MLSSIRSSKDLRLIVSDKKEIVFPIFTASLFTEQNISSKRQMGEECASTHK